jgi:serine/threonine protein kinase/WD40 repeat protein
MPLDPAKVESIFNAALPLADAERQAYLATACGSDTALRSRVEALLTAHRENPASFLQPDDSKTFTSHPSAPLAERPGTMIGPYKLLEQIGEGGFGVVYMAEQERPIRRKVALKIIKPGMDTRQVIARFEAERQALALMDHPNIAQVFDAGETASGRPYFVMELVKGMPITAYCDQGKLGLKERLELFVHVCQAVQHAHHKGIVHRDIKPSNILVTLHDGVPVVKVIDFGIAKAMGQELTDKLTDKTLFTGFAQVLGTPLYASPEQVALGGLDIDTRTDVYSLGVLLYELLTGTTPFEKERLQKAAFEEMRRIVREEEPPRPSTRMTTVGERSTMIAAQRGSVPRRLAQVFRGELDWVVMKALEKDRVRRYETPVAFAGDIARYLANDPVEARPPTAVYRMGKFVRRHKWGATVAAAGVAVLVLIAVGSALAAREFWIQEQEKEKQRAAAVRAEARADQEAQSAVAARRQALMNLADAYTTKGLDAADVNGLAALWFAKAAVTAVEDPERVRTNMIRVNNWLRYQSTPVAAVESPYTERLEFEPENARYLITYSRNGSTPAYVWDLANERQLQLPQGFGRLRAATWAPGRRLLVGSAEGHVALLTMSDRMVVGRWETGGPVRYVAASADGLLVAAATGKKLLVWTTAGATQPAIAEHPADVAYVAFAPKGSLLVTATESDSKANVFSVETGSTDSLQLRPAIPPVTHVYRGSEAASGTRSPLFALEGQTLVTVKDLGAKDRAGTIEWHDTRTGATSASTDEGLWRLGDMTMVPGGKIVAVRMGASQFYDATTHRRIAFYGGPNSQAFDGTGGVMAYMFDGVRLLPFSTGMLGSPKFPVIGGYQSSVGLSNDAKFLAVLVDGRVIVYALPDAEETRLHPVALKGRTSWVGFSPDGAYMAPIGTTDKYPEVRALQVFESATGKPAGPEIDLSGMLVSAAFSPDGRWIAGLTGIRQDPRRLRIWDWHTGAQVGSPIVLDTQPIWVAYAPDGQAVAVHCIDGKVVLFDPANGRELLRVQCAARRNTDWPWFPGRGTLRFSRDGRTFFTCGSPVVEAWDRATGKVRYVVKKRGECWGLAESPDGTLLATAWMDGSLLFTDTTSGKETRPPISHPAALYNVNFSPDGRMVCTISKEACVWNLQDGTLVNALVPDSSFSYASFTPDGRWLVTAGGLYLWDWQSGFPITRDLTPGASIVGINATLDISADGQRFAACGSEGKFVIADLTQFTTPCALSPDDALTWCELLSMMRVSGAATVGLTSDEWLQRWRQFEARHPEVRFPGAQPAGPGVQPAASAPASSTASRPAITFKQPREAANAALALVLATRTEDSQYVSAHSGLQRDLATLESTANAVLNDEGKEPAAVEKSGGAFSVALNQAISRAESIAKRTSETPEAVSKSRQLETKLKEIMNQ